MNLQDKAMKLLVESKSNVLVVGRTGAGKTTLIRNSRIPNSKYFDFVELLKSEWPGHGILIEEVFHSFEPIFLGLKEEVLILDGVEFPKDIGNSQLIGFIKTIRKKNKRLIVVAYPENVTQVLELFGVVISMEMSSGQEYITYSIENAEEKGK
ncbi:hypothetical protein JJL91_002606 [Salmonella enterica]|nr:hypothetical protein [Salmonella enterica]